MSISAFNDKQTLPSLDELRTTLGGSQPWWEQIQAFMFEMYQLPGEMKYGGKNYGWFADYRKGSRPLLALYPRQEGITVQIVLGKAEAALAKTLELGAHLASTLRETVPFHDGLWMFVPLESQEDVQDVLALVQVKAKPRRKPGLKTGASAADQDTPSS